MTDICTQQLPSTLPQRFPLLLIDRVHSRSSEAIVASKNITLNEPCYRGLTTWTETWRYAYPESLLLESFGQAAALLWGIDDLVEGTLMFVGARGVEFLQPAYPGDRVEHHVHLDYVMNNTCVASGSSWVNGSEALRIESITATKRTLTAAQQIGAQHEQFQ